MPEEGTKWIDKLSGFVFEVAQVRPPDNLLLYNIATKEKIWVKLRPFIERFEYMGR